MKESAQNWMIDELRIVLFKSIVSLNIKPARVNVFIGKPNSGKSNLLEALAFLSMDAGALTSVPKEQIRYTDTVSLFYDQNLKYDKDVTTRLLVAAKMGEEDRRFVLEPSYKANFNLRALYGNKNLTGVWTEWYCTVSPDGRIFDKQIQPQPPPLSNIKKYQFSHISAEQVNGGIFQLLPDGANLGSVVRHSASLKEFASSFYKEFSLEVLYDQKGQIKIIKRIGDSLYEVDFSMTPDTFQRMLYYLAAIESNKHSIILLEEPESQSYPPYIQMLAERIVDDTDNQYFITTHSPFIVEKMLERAMDGEDIKIFATYYHDYQTKVHALAAEEINRVIANGIDLFFNIKAFENDGT